MYIGIYISDSFISAGTVNQDNETLLIKDESIAENKKYLTPLKIYIENNFAYLGNQVDYLISNDYHLIYKEGVLDGIANIDTAIYKDKTNTSWNGVSILSIFLNKLKSDILVFDDSPIQGAVITLSRELTPAIVKALKLAFEMTAIPFCGVVDIGKAALLGYAIENGSSRVKSVLLYSLNPSTLTINVLSIDEDNYQKTKTFNTNTKLGDQTLYTDISNFILKRYEDITKTEIKKNQRNTQILQSLAEETLRKYLAESNLYITVLCAFADPILELIMTRSQIETIISRYIEQTLDVLKECVKTSEMEIDEVDEIMLTGTSRILKPIQKHLCQIFNKEKVIIHNNDYADQVITRGVTKYANTTIDREISASLLADSKEIVDSSKDDSTKKTIRFKELHTLIHTMHINMGYDA